MKRLYPQSHFQSAWQTLRDAAVTLAGEEDISFARQNRLREVIGELALRRVQNFSKIKKLSKIRLPAHLKKFLQRISTVRLVAPATDEFEDQDLLTPSLDSRLSWTVVARGASRSFSSNIWGISGSLARRISPGRPASSLPLVGPPGVGKTWTTLLKRPVRHHSNRFWIPITVVSGKKNHTLLTNATTSIAWLTLGKSLI